MRVFDPGSASESASVVGASDGYLLIQRNNEKRGNGSVQMEIYTQLMPIHENKEWVGALHSQLQTVDFDRWTDSRRNTHTHRNLRHTISAT